MAVQALSTILPVLYLCLAFLHGMEFGGPRAPKPRLLRRFCVVALVAAHLTTFAVKWRLAGHLPVTDAGSVASGLALSIVLIFHLVARLARSSSPGVFILSFAFLLVLASSAFGDPVPRRSELADSPFFAAHVLTAVLATACLFLSGTYGGLYLLLLANIRNRRFGALFQGLPDLATLARLNRRSALVGFLLLTIGVNVGIWWAHSGAVSRLDYLDPKVLPWILLWVVFGIIAVSRVVKLLSDRKAAWLSFGCASAMVAALLVSFIPSGMIHRP